LTSPEFILGEHFLEVVKGLASNCLYSMESVHNIGLDMGVLCGPTKSLKLLASSNENTFENFQQYTMQGRMVLLIDVMHGIQEEAFLASCL
jgi:hypothetical protein